MGSLNATSASSAVLIVQLANTVSASTLVQVPLWNGLPTSASSDDKSAPCQTLSALVSVSGACTALKNTVANVAPGCTITGSGLTVTPGASAWAVDTAATRASEQTALRLRMFMIFPWIE